MFSKKSRPSSAESLEAQDDQELCAVCVDLARLNFFKRDKRQVIAPQPATHGGGNWRACYEHYLVISSLDRLVYTGDMDVVLYNPLEEKRQMASQLAAYRDYDENCGCQRCMTDSGRSIWYEIVCSQCQRPDCLRTSDHRLSCGLSLPQSDDSAP